jgi:predicted GNAT family acetyltransferase
MNEVQLKINDNKGVFYIDVNGKHEAMMTFVFAGEDKIIIDHTEVNPGNEGKGFGKKMVTKAVEYAREKGIKIIPLCPFAKSVETFYNFNFLIYGSKRFNQRIQQWRSNHCVEKRTVHSLGRVRKKQS